GRVLRGSVGTGESVVLTGRGKEPHRARVTKVYTHLGLDRVETERTEPGDIVVLSGLEDVNIGDTISSPDAVEQLPSPSVDVPTVGATFSPTPRPFAGGEGTSATSRLLADRLGRELLTNVALRVERLGSERYRVSGRGELHL